MFEKIKLGKGDVGTLDADALVNGGSRVVTATGSAAAGPQLSGAMIEQAMSAAVEACAAEGITDPDKIREAKLAAREAVKAQVRKEQEKSAAKVAGA